MWESSTFRLILISCNRKEFVEQPAFDRPDHIPENLKQCGVCVDHLPRSPANCLGCTDLCEGRLKPQAQGHGLPTHWCCSVHEPGDFPVISFHDMVQGTHTCRNRRTECDQRSPTHKHSGAAPLAHLSGSGLATIRESRCLSDQHLPPIQPTTAISNQTSGTLPELSQISVFLDVHASRVYLQLVVSEAKAQQAGTLLCPDVPSACEQSEGALGTDQEVHGEPATSCTACCWQLQVHKGSSATVLMDTVIDLNASVTPVPHTCPRQLFGHALPARCVILGVCSGREDALQQQQGNPKVERHQELLLHPPLADLVLKQLLGDNQSTKRASLPPAAAEKMF